MFIVKLVVNEKLMKMRAIFVLMRFFYCFFFFLCSFPSLEHRQACIEIHEKDMEHSFAVQRCNHFSHLGRVICCMLFLLIDLEHIFCLVPGARVSRVESV